MYLRCGPNYHPSGDALLCQGKPYDSCIRAPYGWISLKWPTFPSETTDHGPRRDAIGCIATAWSFFLSTHRLFLEGVYFDPCELHDGLIAGFTEIEIGSNLHFGTIVMGLYHHVVCTLDLRSSRLNLVDSLTQWQWNSILLASRKKFTMDGCKDTLHACQSIHFPMWTMLSCFFPEPLLSDHWILLPCLLAHQPIVW